MPAPITPFFQNWTEIYCDTGVPSASVAANTTQRVPFDDGESRIGPIDTGIGPVPILPKISANSSIVTQAEGFYFIHAEHKFYLANTIGAAPIIVQSTLFTGPAARSRDFTTVRAGAAADPFLHKMTYLDRLTVGEEVYIETTTGSTPVTEETNTAETWMIVVYLGPYVLGLDQ